MTHFFLESVEVVDDDTNEEVQSEERSTNDEEDEVEVDVDVALQTRLFVVVCNVCGRCHHFHPTFKRRLKHKQIVTNIIPLRLK